MDEAKEIKRVILVTDNQVSEVTQPRKKTFNLPSSLVPSQWPSILPVAFDPITSVGRNHLYSLLRKFFVQRVTVVCPVSNEPYWLIGNKSRSNRLSNQGNFMRASAFFVDGDRKTSAVCNCHEFRTFSSLGLANTESPFLAGMKVPSIKHSSRSSLPLCFRSSAKVLRMLSNVPFLVHSWNQRWQVWKEGYLSGNSGHGAPVRKIQRMPLRTILGSFLGLPRPSFLTGFGIKGSITSHCLSVKSTASPNHPIFNYV